MKKYTYDEAEALFTNQELVLNGGDGTAPMSNYDSIIVFGDKTVDVEVSFVINETVFYRACGRQFLSMAKIAKEAQKVFDKLYTVEDILKGNTIEMHSEARKIAVNNLSIG